MFARGDKLLPAASADVVVRRLEPVLVSSSSRTSQRRASSLVTSFVAFFSRRRSSSYASYASSFFFSSKNDESGDETNDGSVPRRGDGDVSRARRAGDGDGSSRRVSVADRYRTRDGVVDDRFLVCVSRLVRCSIPSPPGPGSNAGRDAPSRAVSRNAPRASKPPHQNSCPVGTTTPACRAPSLPGAAQAPCARRGGRAGRTRSRFARKVDFPSNPTKSRVSTYRGGSIRRAGAGLFIFFSRRRLSPPPRTVRTPGAEDGSDARPLRPPDARAGRSRYVTGRLLERRVSPR